MQDAVLVERSPSRTAGTVERFSAVSAEASRSNCETNNDEANAARLSNYRPRFVNNGGLHSSAARSQSHKLCDWCRSRVGTPKTLFAQATNLRRAQREAYEATRNRSDTTLEAKEKFGGFFVSRESNQLQDHTRRRDVQRRWSADKRGAGNCGVLGLRARKRCISRTSSRIPEVFHTCIHVSSN